MPTDLALQLDIVARLALAAFLGGAIGLERELHNHPAGLRTHLLVALGSAVFTVLSIHGFEPAGASTATPSSDPARVAAQVVSGIGFLGAGAIIKYGTTIRGLTTAASLWATAAIGMAAAAGAWFVAMASLALAVASLWPLQALLRRVQVARGRQLRLSFGMDRLAPLGELTAEAARRRLEVLAVHTSRDGEFRVDLDVRLPGGAIETEVIEGMASVEGVRLRDATALGREDG